MKIKSVSMQEFTDFMHNISGGLMLLGQTIISAFFVLIILGLVLYVEIERVGHGIALFEQSEKLAYMGAFVLVMMLMTLEFVIHYVEAKNNYHQPRKERFSFELVKRWWSYIDGSSTDWKAQYKSPAHDIRNYAKLLTRTILALALGGSMSSTITAIDGNWMQGIKTIVLDSSLIELIEWAGGLLFALALVIGAQRLTSYVAQRASETLAGDKPHKQAIKHDESTQKHDIAIVTVEPESEFMPFMPVKPVEEHSIDCPDCGKEFTGYKTEGGAKKALQAHKRFCEMLSPNRLEIVE